MTWGGLNNALTAWRNAVERRLGAIRGRNSDGARADAAHGSTSQHQADSDGTVDAFDMDVNVQGSADETGTAAELRLIEAMKLDFEQDPHGRSLLWIHQREIANDDVGDWRERAYGGKSPHDHHVHWESRQGREDDGREWPMPHTDALLREMEDLPVKQTDFDKLFLAALDNPEIGGKLEQLAGRGVHNQKLGKGPETIGQDLQGDDAALAEGFTAVQAQLDQVLAKLNTPPAKS